MANEQSKIIITTKEQLKQINDNLSGDYVLGCDIDLANQEWIPIGNYKNAFKGSFDGAGYTISNLSIQNNDNYGNYKGLFYLLYGASIKNTTIQNVFIDNKSYLGAFAGKAVNTNINNCHVINVNITSAYEKCGGLIGATESNTVISNCSAKASIRVADNLENGKYTALGGLVGTISYSTVTKCYSDSNIESNNNSVGGLVGGTYESTIKESYSIGDIKGHNGVGGLIGGENASKIIENCYTLGIVRPTNDESEYIGGFIGYFSGFSNLKNCYSGCIVDWDVPFKKSVNGFVGNDYNAVGKAIINSYYDGVLAKKVPAYNGVPSKLTSSMVQKSTFIGWDFNEIWNIDEGNSYPYLRALSKPVGIIKNSLDDVAGGMGTQESPYIVGNKRQLNNIRYELDSSYILRNDIDLEDETWMPIGFRQEFRGSFDGNGYTISRLKIDKDYGWGYYGLFSKLKRASIKNITIESGRINSYLYTGTLAGRATHNSTITNVSVTNINLNGTSGNCGGLIGNSENSIITDCMSGALIEARDVNGKFNSIGGIIGSAYKSTINICYSNTVIIGNQNNIGGIVGYINESTISKCYNVGNIQGFTNVGGIVGADYRKSIIINCFSIGDISSISNGSYIGGICGYIPYDGRLENCYFVGTVVGNKIGGIGYCFNVKNCYYNSTTSGLTATPGIAKTTQELMDETTYASTWDFTNIWGLDDTNTYPYLRDVKIPILPEFPFRLDKPNLNITNKTYSSINLEWNAVNNAESYELEIDGELISVSLLGYIHSGLEYNSLHTYRVRGKLWSRTSEWSNLITTRPKIANIPIPTNITTENTEKSITISWDKANDLDGYDIEINGKIIECGSINEYHHIDLDPNVTYKYRLRGKKDGIDGNWSRLITVTTSYIGDVTLIKADEITESSIKLIWQHVANSEGYDIEIDGTIYNCENYNVYMHKNLTANTEHIYKVRAVTKQGHGKWSEELIVSTVTLDPPLNIQTESKEDSISITWNQSQGATAYEIEVDDNALFKCDSNEFEHTNLTTNSIHRYRVRTVKDNIKGRWSIVIQAFTTSDNISIPQNITAIAGGTEIYIKWDKVFEANDYDLEIDGNIINTKNNNYKHIDLVSKEQHSYRIKAKGVTSSSEWSNKVIISTLEDGAILITDANELKKINKNLAGHYILAENINLEKENWVPLGSSNKPFSGIFNGKDLIISNLNINSENPNTGLFSSITGTVSNLILQDVNINGNTMTGSVAGFVDKGILESIRVTGGLSGERCVGGLAGRSNSANILGCITDVSIKAYDSCAGGLIGLVNKSTLSQCYSIASVDGATEVGGLIGYIDEDTSIDECYSIASLYGREKYIGGLIGSIRGDNIEINNCFVNGTIDGTENDVDYIGGVIGLDINNSTTLRNTYAAVSINVECDNKSNLSLNTGNEKLIGTYYDKSISNAIDYLDMGKETLELFDKESYQGWDFESIWSIVNNTYPTLKKLDTPNSKNYPIVQLSKPVVTIEEVNSRQIKLKWGAVNNAEGYEVIVNNSMYEYTQQNYIDVDNLDRDMKYRISIRAKTGDVYSEKSKELLIKTEVFNAPKSITTDLTINSINLSWDKVESASTYDVEINGFTMQLGDEDNYLHQDLCVNSEYTYRVRARDGNKTGKWSELLIRSTLPRDAILINNADELIGISSGLGLNYALNMDIDLSGKQWEPIGTVEEPFSGILTGQGYTITGLSVNKSNTDNIGLFGVVTGVIKDLCIENSLIVGASNVGALAGSIMGTSAVVTNCSVVSQHTIQGSQNTGALIGKLTNGTVQNCKTQADVHGAKVGGLIGLLEDAELEKCYTTAVVQGDILAGGLVGSVLNSNIRHCMSNCKVKLSFDENNIGKLGGLIAEGNESIKVQDCFAIGEADYTGDNGIVGGFIGTMLGSEGLIENCYTLVKINSDSHDIGGFIGMSSVDNIINCCFNIENLFDGLDTELGVLPKEMTIVNAFKNWNFNAIWKKDVLTNLPVLRQLKSPKIQTLDLEEFIGMGTISNPYIIYTAKQLQNIRYAVERHYRLGANIHLHNTIFQPIGSSNRPFSGSLDGAGYSIDGLTINNKDNTPTGLFGTVSGTIRNLKISKAAIVGIERVGILAGEVKQGSIIDNCSVEGSVTGETILGGVVGKMLGARISKVKTTVEILGDGVIGGLVGEVSNESNRIILCIGDSNIKVNKVTNTFIGGLVGRATELLSIENSISRGSIDWDGFSDISIGRLLGKGNTKVVIINSYSVDKINPTVDTTFELVAKDLGVVIRDSYYLMYNTRFTNIEDTSKARVLDNLQNKQNYDNWDFEKTWIMDIETGLPTLQCMDYDYRIDNSYAIYKNGSGSKNNPYIIDNITQFKGMRFSPDKHFALGNNINFNGELLKPIGDLNSPFVGSFDGRGYTLENINLIHDGKDYIGLFGVFNGEVENLNMKNIVAKGKERVGCLVGHAIGGQIENCKVTGIISTLGDDLVGGMIGYANNTIIKQCNLSGNLYSDSGVIGGLVGQLEEGVIVETSVNGQIKGSGTIGGLVGINKSNSQIKECYFNGYINIAGTSDAAIVGGLLGEDKGEISITNAFVYSDLVTHKDQIQRISGVIGVGNQGSFIENTYVNIDTNLNNIQVISPFATDINESKLSHSYFNFTHLGIEEPEELGKTTQELTHKATYLTWDFDNVWDIKEGLSYPYLRSLTSPTDENHYPKSLDPALPSIEPKIVSSVKVSWDSVKGAEGYLLSINGVINDLGNAEFYDHINLSEGELNSYRVKAYNNTLESCWSKELIAGPLTQVDIDITAEIKEDSIKLLWNEISGATSYVVEVDGKSYSTDSNIFTHKDFVLNTQHTYRVRAYINQSITTWSNRVYAIKWSNDKPALCFALDKQNDDEATIILKANGFKDLYSIDLKIDFNDNINVKSVFNKFGTAEDSYFYTSYGDDITRIRTIASRLGSNSGLDGSFDIMSINVDTINKKDILISMGCLTAIDSMLNEIEVANVGTISIANIEFDK